MALDQVREGVKGQVFIPGLGMHEGWISKPDPGRFVDLYVKLIEFAAPKLQRSEVVTKPDAPEVPALPDDVDQVEATRIYQQVVGG
jgi:hypothetical protein